MAVERVVEVAVGDLEGLRPRGVGPEDIGVEVDGHAAAAEIKVRVGGEVINVGVEIIVEVIVQSLFVDPVHDLRGERIDQRFAEGAVGRGLRVQTVERQKFAGGEIEAPGEGGGVRMRAAVEGVGIGKHADEPVGLVDDLAEQFILVVDVLKGHGVTAVMVARLLSQLRLVGEHRGVAALHLGVEGVAHGNRRALCGCGAGFIERAVGGAKLKLRQLIICVQQERAVVGSVGRFMGERRADGEGQLRRLRLGGLWSIGLARIDLDGAGAE